MAKRYHKRKGNTLALVVVAAAVAGLVVGLVLSGITVPGGRSTGVSSAEAAEVEKHFDCPCDQCSLTLSECHCDHPRGAREVRGFIADQFKGGKTVAEVIEAVKAKYGHHKA